MQAEESRAPTESLKSRNLHRLINEKFTRLKSCYCVDSRSKRQGINPNSTDKQAGAKSSERVVSCTHIDDSISENNIEIAQNITAGAGADEP